jgi:hypothetical protein
MPGKKSILTHNSTRATGGVFELSRGPKHSTKVVGDSLRGMLLDATETRVQVMSWRRMFARADASQYNTAYIGW